MKRYFHSFIISSIFYISVIVGVVYFINIEEFSKADADTNVNKKVCFSVITQKETPKPKIEKKPEPKKKSKPKPKPKPLPEPVKEEPIAKPEPITEETIEEDIEIQEVAKPVKTETKNEINPEVVQAKQDQFISNLIHKINTNKFYPTRARRRGLEGLVTVKFKVLSDGNVKDIKILSGRNIFKKSAKEAISKSFPVIVKDSLFNFPKEFKIKLSYILK
jgi:protein TonB